MKHRCIFVLKYNLKIHILSSVDGERVAVNVINSNLSVAKSIKNDLMKFLVHTIKN